MSWRDCAFTPQVLIPNVPRSMATLACRFPFLPLLPPPPGRSSAHEPWPMGGWWVAGGGGGGRQRGRFGLVSCACEVYLTGPPHKVTVHTLAPARLCGHTSHTAHTYCRSRRASYVARGGVGTGKNWSDTLSVASNLASSLNPLAISGLQRDSQPGGTHIPTCEALYSKTGFDYQMVITRCSCFPARPSPCRSVFWPSAVCSATRSQGVHTCPAPWRSAGAARCTSGATRLERGGAGYGVKLGWELVGTGMRAGGATR